MSKLILLMVLVFSALQLGCDKEEACDRGQRIKTTTQQFSKWLTQTKNGEMSWQAFRDKVKPLARFYSDNARFFTNFADRNFTAVHQLHTTCYDPFIRSYPCTRERFIFKEGYDEMYYFSTELKILAHHAFLARVEIDNKGAPSPALVNNLLPEDFFHIESTGEWLTEKYCR